jgi:hypothetical protein
MSTLLSAREICERALRLIGAYSLVDSQADAEEMREALHWLDLVVGELSGTERVLWLVPDTLTLPLAAGKSVYNLLDDLSPAPRNGIEFPTSAALADGAGNRTPLTMLRRREFEALGPDTGTPSHVYVDRLGQPTLSIWPVLGADVADGTWSIKLVAQTYGEDFAKGNGVKATGLRAAWQIWAVYELASHIGGGAVRRLPRSEIVDFKAIATEARRKLLAVENREHAGLPQITEFRDF